MARSIWRDGVAYSLSSATAAPPMPFVFDLYPIPFENP
jgi:hypothetical protein